MTARAAFAALLAASCGGSDPAGDDGPSDAGSDFDASADAGVGGATPDYDRIFALDVLHEIDIVVAEGDLDTLENDRETRVPCTFTFDGTTLEDVGIRQKGGYGSSSTLDGKPGFSVKFDEIVPGQRLFDLRKILLNNAQEDATFLSEHVGYEAHRRAGRPATHTAHGIVTLNGFTYGLFVLREPIGSDFLGRTFGEENDGGNLYEGFYHPEDQSLGDFVLHPDQPELKDEEEGRTRDDLVALAAAIADSDDAGFEAAVSARMDLDGYVTSFALDSILGYWDSYHYFLNNFYLYDDPATGQFSYLPSGMDQLQYSTLSGPMGRLPQRIHEIPELDARFEAEVDRLRAEWDEGAMLDRIDAVEAVVHSTTRTDDRTLADLASFDDHVGSVRESVSGI